MIIRDLYVSDKRIWLGPHWHTKIVRGPRATVELKRHEKDYAFTVGTRGLDGKVGIAKAPMHNVMLAHPEEGQPRAPMVEEGEPLESEGNGSS